MIVPTFQPLTLGGPGGVQMLANSCRTSPTTVAYWTIISIFAWLGLSAIGLIWYPLHATSATTILLAMSVGCVANWVRNRTCHCCFDGPLLFASAAAFLLRQIGIVRFPSFVVWSVLAVGTAISFFLEWRVTSKAR